MTAAVLEILRQTKNWSVSEKIELAIYLLERVRVKLAQADGTAQTPDSRETKLSQLSD